jgi:hypothetical protein
LSLDRPGYGIQALEHGLTAARPEFIAHTQQSSRQTGGQQCRNHLRKRDRHEHPTDRVAAGVAAARQMLVKEKVLTRARDALAAERRRMPWVAGEGLRV